MPTDPSLVNYNDEIRAINSTIARQNYVKSQVSRFTPASTARYTKFARMYPWMSPGMVRAASLAGLLPESPEAASMSRMSYAEGIDSRRLQRGRRVTAGSISPNLIGREREQAYFEKIRPRGREAEQQYFERTGGGLPKDHAREQAIFNIASQYSENDLKKLVKSDPAKARRYIIALESGQGLYGGRRSFVPRAETVERAEEQISGTPIIGPIFGAAQAVIEPAYEHVIKPAARGAGMVANYPVQEFQQAGRNIRQAVQGVQQNGFSFLLESPPDEMKFGGESTDLGVAAEHLVSGDRVDTGSGLFVSPQSQVARERVRREAEAGTIGGHNITWGRWIADTITTPDTTPFNVLSGFVDFSIQLADPSAAGLGAVGKTRQAKKLFQAEEIVDDAAKVGLFRGRKFSVDPMTSKKFFDTDPRAQRAVDDLTTDTSAFSIGQKMSRSRHEIKHDPALYRELAKSTTPEETRFILEDAIGTGSVREIADLSKSWGHGIAAAIRPRMPAPRLLDKLPGIGFRPSDPIESANTLTRTMRNARVPEPTIERFFNQMAEARTPYGRREAFVKAVGDSEGILVHEGLDPDLASEVARLYGTSINDMHRGLVDEIAEEIPTWDKVLANGEVTQIPGPHALTELIEDWVPVPDSRSIRTLTSKYPNLTKSLPEGKLKDIGVELPKAAVDYWMQEIWKPLVLARGAWLVRVLGEEQIRLTNFGYDTLFSGHAISAIGFMMSKPKGKLATSLGLKPRGAHAATGELFNEITQYDDAMSKVHNWAYRPGVVPTNIPTKFGKAKRAQLKEYKNSWAKQLIKYNHDPVYSKWLQTDSLDEFQTWLVKGPGRKFLASYQEAFPGNLQNATQVRKFADDIDQRFHTLTHGNTDLYDILRSGKFTDSKGNIKSIYTKNGKPDINPAFTKHLAKYVDDAGPEFVPGTAVSGTRGASDYPKLRKETVQNFLYGSMSLTTNKLNRSPVFRQSYWTKEVPDLFQFADESTRARFLAAAKQENIPARTIERMENISATKVPGILNFDEMDLLAKGNSINAVEKSLYSYSQRRQIFDVFRNLTPFGDAWYEVISTWGRIVSETAGKPLRRAQQLTEGAINSGFFYENPYGEMAFTYPMSQAITSAMTGVPVAMEGRVKGLSMFGELVPGIGPVAQIPAAWFLEDQPNLSDLEDILLPYGAPEGAELLNFKTWMPPWMKTGLSAVGIQSAEDKRMWENTIAQIANYKYSQGNYGNSEAEQARLWQDSKADAKQIYGLRTLAQFWAPASPRLEFYTQDKSGRNLATTALTKEFYDSLEDPDTDYETAVGEFIDKYGEDAIGGLVAKSASSAYGIPDSKEALEWVRNNSDIKGDFPLTYGLFAPKGEFDIEIFSNQFATGERQGLTSRQHISLINEFMNRYWRNTLMEEMGVSNYTQMTGEQQDAWEKIGPLVDEEYPSSRFGIIEKPQIDDMIKELERAGNNKKIQSTDAGRALSSYMELRTDAQSLVEEMKSGGYISEQTKGFTRSDGTRPIREALRGEARNLVNKYPDFQPLWEFVLSRELIED